MNSARIIRSPAYPEMGLLAAGSFTAGSLGEGPGLWLGLGVAALAGLSLTRRRRAAPALRLREEIRAPLQSLSGFAELLAHAGPPEERARHAESLGLSLREVTSAIDCMAELSRLEAGRLRLVPQDNDAAELLGVALRACAGPAREKGVALTADPLPAASLPGDAARLSRLLSGLFRFALSRTGKGGMLHVKIRTRQRRLTVSLPAPGAAAALETGADSGLCLAAGLARLHGGALRASRHGLTLTLRASLRP